MPRLSYPTALIAEFRGVEEASSFVNRETGEQVQRPATLKLEREMPGGDVLPIEVPLRSDVELGFHLSELQRGELLQLVGEVVTWSGRDGKGGAWLQVVSLHRASSNGGKVAA
jgi:hypothetical protein